MIKPYPHHHLRKVESLNELWHFVFHEGRSLDAVTHEEMEAADQKIPVPGAFDAMPDYLGKRGTAVYKRTLHITAGSEAILEFEAVSFACRILVDGVMLKEHFCGYAPFSVRLPSSENSQRQLVVLAENQFDYARIPMHEHFFDFYQFGGIIRPVWLHHLDDSNEVIAVRVDATDYKGGKVSVHGSVNRAGTLSATLLDTAAAPMEINTEADGRFSFEFTVPDPIAWSPEDPHLYRLQVVFGNDDQVVRFGIRKFEADGKMLRLNGKEIRLFGYNRHEYFPNFGPTTPYAQMVNDIQLLKDCGCNFIRGAHYPQDQSFLDLCDELGLLIWEENLGWQQGKRQLEDPKYLDHHQTSLEEMVGRSYNHPCVIIWGFLNEGPSDETCFRPIFDRSVKYLRDNGGNRLISYGSNRIERDDYLEEVDIISINCYPGWYGCEDHPEPLSLIAPFIAGFIQHLEERGLRNKPFMISEIGCEGLYGWRDEMRDFHSENYQEDYLSTVCHEVINNDRMCGLCLWHFSDARTKSRGRALGRPRAFNNKGTFDEYRRPKLARDAVRTLFRAAMK